MVSPVAGHVSDDDAPHLMSAMGGERHLMSWVKTPVCKPYRDALTRSNACSTSSTEYMLTTGPKVSSLATLAVSLTSTSAVGSYVYPSLRPP
jgi:hypothetical protein